MVMSSVEWAVDEYGSAALGDARRVARLISMAAGFADKPAGTVTEAFSTTAERRAVYRFLDNEDVDAASVATAAYSATVRRCEQLDVVIVPVDGTSLNITDDVRVRGTGPVGARSSGARGFQVMTAIGVAPDGTPLGLLGQAWWTRTETKATKASKQRTPEEKETQHWLTVLESTRALFSTGRCRPWYQLDRGGDAWPVLLMAHHADIYLTVRAAHDRRIIVDAEAGERVYLWQTLRDQNPLGHFTIEVTGRPGRKPRTATMAVRSTMLTLNGFDTKSKEKHPIHVSAVYAVEVGTTPPGEKALEWMLLTNRPAATFEDACTVVLAYTYRWKIEEFHKTWKTGGCNVEDTQLHSEHGVHVLAFVLATVAMRLQRLMWISRTDPGRPATEEFSDHEIAAVFALKNVRRSGRSIATIGRITLWIAELGGYTGKSSGGPPGAITLGRGLAQIYPVARALRNVEKLRLRRGDRGM
jgi:Transposase DNA-binding/Transposase DDE domain